MTAPGSPPGPGSRTQHAASTTLSPAVAVKGQGPPLTKPMPLGEDGGWAVPPGWVPGEMFRGGGEEGHDVQDWQKITLACRTGAPGPLAAGSIRSRCGRLGAGGLGARQGDTPCQRAHRRLR